MIISPQFQKLMADWYGLSSIDLLLVKDFIHHEAGIQYVIVWMNLDQEAFIIGSFHKIDMDNKAYLGIELNNVYIFDRYNQYKLVAVKEDNKWSFSK